NARKTGRKTEDFRQRITDTIFARRTAGETGVSGNGMNLGAGLYGAQLRRELALRNRRWARGRLHVETYGSEPVIVYSPEEERHGNFFDPAYGAILARKDWRR